MPPQKTQPNQHPPMSPDEAMASLAFATHLQNQMLEHQNGNQPVNASQTQQNAPESTEAPETSKVEGSEKPDENEAKMTKLELDMSKKFDDLRKELDEKHKLELDKLRNDIKEALDAEEKEEPNEQD